ncbi:MAG: MMPL family transporter [Saprospiraceae bacterium]|nr:MMPL family transporter [Saprospiraceae bacterium]
MFLNHRNAIIIFFAFLTIISGYYTTKLQFSFSFDQFFPIGDPDLEYYKKFTKDFETDDNFLLIAIENKPSVFDSVFLARFHDVSLKVRDLPFVKKTQSITQLEYPVKTPFGYSLLPFIHIDDPEYYPSDKQNVTNDERIVNSLIDSAATSLVIFVKTDENLDILSSRILTERLDSLLLVSGFSDKAHILGRAYFQRELVDFQKREMMMAFMASLILVTFIMVVLYRKPIGIIISLGSIALGLLLFTGYLGFVGAELSVISALFPVIMLIVGSSDVIHIFSKYVDELNKGNDQKHAMRITIREIGAATFMTSFTTAIGFASLATSKLLTIQQFGLHAAVGVIIAFVTVILFTTSALSYFNKDKIIRSQNHDRRWSSLMEWIVSINMTKATIIFKTSFVLIIIFILGTSMISTNYRLEDNLPRGAKVTQSFQFFEKNYAGFRPLEFAITAKGQHLADDYEVLKEVNKLEEKIRSTGIIRSSISLATLYKSINKMNSGNQDSTYSFPKTKEEYENSKRLVQRMKNDDANILLSTDKTKTRISSRVTDIGADNIKKLGEELDTWSLQHLDTSLIEVKRTGTGLILDKNSVYVTSSLLKGLGFSIFIISLFMGWIFRSFKMVIIALIPNLLPLLLAAAILGFFHIDLEAGISVMFTIIFGIAVDDSIHILARYRICKSNGMNTNAAVRVSLMETGKAVIITTIVLFFGFFAMIFSVNPPTFTIGLLISVTLLGALICDLFLLPALLLRFYKD